MSSIPADTTENLLLAGDTAKNLFFNKELLDTLTSNFYNTLIFKEIADYRIAEFAKPLTQDPQFMIVKIPATWNLKKDKKIANFDFEGVNDIGNWKENYYPISSYVKSQIDKVGTKRSKAMSVKQNTPHCNSTFNNFSSPKIQIDPESWYTLSASAKRIANTTYKNTRSGFFRLDFYTEDNVLTKTYVTKPLSAVTDWQELNTAGASPQNAKYARVGFHIDTCLDIEEYLLDNVSLFTTENSPEIDKNTYSFFDKEAINFFWLPQL